MTTATAHKNKIVIRETKSRRVRNFGITKRLSKLEMNGYHQYFLNELSALEDGSDNFLACEEVRRTVSQLLKVKGVIWIIVRTHEINVHICYAMDWSEIQWQLLNIMQANLFASDGVTIENRTNQKDTDTSPEGGYDRIRARDTNSKQIRHFGVSERLTAADMNGYHEYCLRDLDHLKDGTDKFLDSPQARQTIISLLQTTGVEYVLVRPYEMNVKRAHVMSWNDLDGVILAVLQKELFGDKFVHIDDWTDEHTLNPVPCPKTARIRIRHTNSREIRHFGVTERLTIGQFPDYITYYPHHVVQLEDGCAQYLNSAEARSTIATLLKTPGVTSVLVRPHEINIGLASVFDWEEFQQEIVETIKTGLFANEPAIEIEDMVDRSVVYEQVQPDE